MKKCFHRYSAKISLDNTDEINSSKWYNSKKTIFCCSNRLLDHKYVLCFVLCKVLKIGPRRRVRSDQCFRISKWTNLALIFANKPIHWRTRHLQPIEKCLTASFLGYFYEFLLSVAIWFLSYIVVKLFLFVEMPGAKSFVFT